MINSPFFGTYIKKIEDQEGIFVISAQPHCVELAATGHFVKHFLYDAAEQPPDACSINNIPMGFSELDASHANVPAHASRQRLICMDSFMA